MENIPAAASSRHLMWQQFIVALVKVVLLHVLPGLDGRQDLKRIFGGRPINYEIVFIKLQPNRLKQISPFTLLYAWSLSAEEM